MNLFDFIIYKKFEEGYDLGKREGRIFIIMKIDIFVFNYIRRI